MEKKKLLVPSPWKPLAYIQARRAMFLSHISLRTYCTQSTDLTLCNFLDNWNPIQWRCETVTGYFKSVEALESWIGFDSSRWKSEGKGVGVGVGGG